MKNVNILSLSCGVLNLCAAIESLIKGNWKMAIVFACYAVASAVLAFVK